MKLWPIVREQRAAGYLCRFSHWVSFWWSISFRCSFCSLRCAVIDVIIVDDTILTAFINFYQCGISVNRCCRTRWTNVITSSLSSSEDRGNPISQSKHPPWDPFLFLGIRCTHWRSWVDYVTSYSRVARPCRLFSTLFFFFFCTRLALHKCFKEHYAELNSRIEGLLLN